MWTDIRLLLWTHIRAHVFCPKMPQDNRAITVQRPCILFHGCRKNPTNRLTTHEVRTTVARPHLRQSCNSASTSGNSPAREHKTSVRVSCGCLTFSENLHEVCYFVCYLPHGLTPAAMARHATVVRLMWNRLKQYVVTRLACWNSDTDICILL